ncbi:RNA-guided endonuclease InsQ/TnpB family protein [Sulfurihydrogenibium subterraneum]|uniref:RNA-guided endonuclease InsQ/TnpB family protein n=1 Tax=Sulfurihydrogenibium subterraneum TaxID=171121 RepID=UPI00048AC06A|nr:IS200/IS605 family accessory protein TnpB-related protein [Sulfurihydrogenibium subterraneum]
MDTITLTLNIQISKKSAVNKLSKASKTFQHFKNLIYITAYEYFKHTKNITPFLSVNFLEKYIKGKEKLPFENQKIKDMQKQLIDLWQNKIGSDTAKMLINVIVRECKSIIAKWKTEEKANLPLPRKLSKLHFYTIETNPNMIIDKRNLKRGKSNHIVVRIGKSFGSIKIKVPEGINTNHLKIIWRKEGFIDVFLTYQQPLEKLKLNKDNFLSIDIGINNFISTISNKENVRSFIINGEPLKAFNQWVNKLSAKLQSENKEKEHKLLWNYRDKRISQFFASVSNLLVSLALKENIGTIVISKGLMEEYQKESDKGKRFNQTFRAIPFGKFIQMLKYKCQIAGIDLIITEDESYTSKTSSITGDLKAKEFNGKRVKRGLFKDHITNKVYNADLNGALNVAIKGIGRKIREQFLKLPNWLDKLSRPIKVNLFNKYSASVLKDIADSISLSKDRRRTPLETVC